MGHKGRVSVPLLQSLRLYLLHSAGADLNQDVMGVGARQLSSRGCGSCSAHEKAQQMAGGNHQSEVQVLTLLQNPLQLAGPAGAKARPQLLSAGLTLRGSNPLVVVLIFSPVASSLGVMITWLSPPSRFLHDSWWLL